MKKILLVRDNGYKMNWGCRATSSALKTLLAQRYLVHPLPPIHDIRSEMRVGDCFDVVQLEPSAAVQRFLTAGRSGHLGDNAKLLQDAIDEVDHVVINLEGCAILSTPYRRDLRFTNFVVNLASKMGKGIAIVNGMLSDCPSTPRSQQALEETLSSFQAAHFVSFRDHQSLAYARSLGAHNSLHHPDALFSWAVRYRDFFESPPLPVAALDTFPDRLGFPGLTTGSRAPIAVSAGSKHPSDDESHSFEFYENLSKEIVSNFGYPVLLVTPGGDYFLRDIATTFNIGLVDASTNVLVGSKILSSCTAYVSGRYHPSIMASLGGTPCVFLE